MLDEVLRTPHRKNALCCETLIQENLVWTDTLVRPKQRKKNMSFGTWNVRSLHRSGSLTAAARELVRYKLDLVGVQEIRRDKGGPVRAGDYNFFYGKGNENHQ